MCPELSTFCFLDGIWQSAESRSDMHARHCHNAIQRIRLVHQWKNVLGYSLNNNRTAVYNMKKKRISETISENYKWNPWDDNIKRWETGKLEAFTHVNKCSCNCRHASTVKQLSTSNLHMEVKVDTDVNDSSYAGIYMDLIKYKLEKYCFDPWTTGYEITGLQLDPNYINLVTAT